MTSIQSKLEAFGDALGSINSIDNVYHYWRFGVTPPYLIWQEDSEIGLQADLHKAEQGITGAIEYFTKQEYDPRFDDIQNKLNSLENVYWYYDGSDFEDETSLIHHSWRWRLL